MWQNGFLQSFQQRGWPCEALDLPGHGHLCGDGDIHRHGLTDYVGALARAVAACAVPPVLIGHSMGGYLAQRFVLEGGRAAALVLVAGAPPQGMARELLRFALRHPLLAMQFEFAHRDEDPQRRLARMRTMLMGERSPDAIVTLMIGLLQKESRLALRELSTQSLPARPLGIPTLVLAGGQDQLIGVSAQRGMAADYEAPIEVFPDMGHMLSLEPGWQLVADAIAGFLERHLPGVASGSP